MPIPVVNYFFNALIKQIFLFYTKNKKKESCKLSRQLCHFFHRQKQHVEYPGKNKAPE